MKQTKVAEAYLFTVEADRRDRVEVLVEFEPVQGRSLAGRVKAQHDDMQGALARGQGVEQGRVLPHVGAHASVGAQHVCRQASRVIDRFINVFVTSRINTRRHLNGSERSSS